MRAAPPQALFNEVIYFPSRPGYTDPLVKRRVLDYLLFMNSKVGVHRVFPGCACTRATGRICSLRQSRTVLRSPAGSSRSFCQH